jgi:PAS domain S-box-containing protein
MTAAIKIMVVEDERIVSFNLQQRLSRLGYTVPAVASSGAEALRLANETKPDIVLMDIRIEGDIDGIETAARLNATQPVPVIYLTAHSEDATLERAKETRPYGYLLKPFSEREMHATILMALERRKVEVKLSESEERLRLALDAAEMGVWDMDVSSRQVTLSEKSIDILGLDGTPPVHYENLFDCVDPIDRERIASTLDQCIAQLEPCHVEFRRAAGDDESRWIRIEAKPRADRRVIGVVQDISTRKLAEATLKELNERLESQVLIRTAELRQSLNELNTFSYSVAHDLRAPLRSIIGFSEILLEDFGATLDDAIKHHLNNISAAGTRMAKLIDGLLNLSRLARGKLELHIVDLSALATEIAQELRAAAPDRTVEFIIAPGLTARADYVLIQNVLENLLGNAWKFTARHVSARIEFGGEEINGETAYFVSDDGAGFDMQYADHLFRAFQRLHHNREFEGTGIGLATVQRIVERHGGHIWANSAVEQGSKFYFTLAPRRN